MVENNLGPHPVHELIEALSGETLEEGVGVPLAAHAVDHLAAVQISIHHFIHGVDVVLAVTINGDGDVAAVLGFHEACKDRILMSPIAALADAQIMGVRLGKVFNNIPGVVFRTVIYKEHTAIRGNFSGGFQILDFL